MEAARHEARAVAEGPLLTVALAVQAYVAARDARDTRRNGRAVRSDAARRLTRYVVGRDVVGSRRAIPAAPLAAIPLHELSEGDLLTWRAALPDALSGTTKQRLINDLKAALNGAFAASRKRLPPTFPATVKHALRALSDDGDGAQQVARDNQILSDGQVASLINAAREIDVEHGWEGDLFRLVVALAATGARFSQVARMRVGDVQAKAGRLMVPVSRKGRGGKSGETPVPVGTDVMGALLPAVTKGEGCAAIRALAEPASRGKHPVAARRSRAVAGGIRACSALGGNS